MAVVTETNLHGRLKSDVLENFEHELGASLPEQYRAFLLANNGSVVVPDEITFPRKNQPSAMLDVMLGIYNGPDSLSAVNTNLDSYVPRGALAIATVHGGDVICIGLHGERRGCIFYWPQGESRPGVNHGDWEGMVCLAESFNAFFEALGGPQPGRDR